VSEEEALATRLAALATHTRDETGACVECSGIASECHEAARPSAEERALIRDEIAMFTNSRGQWRAADLADHVAEYVVPRIVAAHEAAAFEEALQAVAWAMDNGPAADALGYVAKNNPYRGAR
jgi:hypothetical protein